MSAAAGVQAILLDFGGVVWNMRWDVGRALEAEHGLPPGSIFDTLYRCEAWQQVERGRGDREAWFRFLPTFFLPRDPRALLDRFLSEVAPAFR